MIEYRSATLDPNPNPAQKTVEFRNLTPPRPECLLEGEQDINGLNSNPPSPNYSVAPGALANSFTGTGFTQSTLVKGVVGYEWDTAGQPGCPAVQKLFTWTGTNKYGAASESDASTFTAPSGARVFSAGTEQFGWALDSFGHTTSVSPPLQAFAQNLLTDLSGGSIAPANTSRPTISGSTVQGQALTATNGTWTGTPAPTFTDQWSRCDTTGANCTAIPSATSQIYTLGPADVGSTLEVTITAINPAGQAQATAPPTPTITGATTATASPPTVIGSAAPPPASVTPPSISGTAAQGHVLTASTGRWLNSPTGYSYRWEDCNRSGTGCGAILGATSRTFLLRAKDVRHRLRVQVSATNGAGTGGPVTTSATAVVRPPPSNAQIKIQLLRNLAPPGRASRISAMLRNGAYVQALDALTAGKAVIGWCYLPKHGHLGKGKPRSVLIATAARTFTAAGNVRITIKLTRSGEHLLKGARQLKLTAEDRFTPTGRRVILVTATFTLTR